MKMIMRCSECGRELNKECIEDSEEVVSYTVQPCKCTHRFDKESVEAFTLRRASKIPSREEAYEILKARSKAIQSGDTDD